MSLADESIKVDLVGTQPVGTRIICADPTVTYHMDLMARFAPALDCFARPKIRRLTGDRCGGVEVLIDHRVKGLAFDLIGPEVPGVHRHLVHPKDVGEALSKERPSIVEGRVDIDQDLETVWHRTKSSR